MTGHWPAGRRATRRPRETHQARETRRALLNANQRASQAPDASRHYIRRRGTGLLPPVQHL